MTTTRVTKATGPTAARRNAITRGKFDATGGADDQQANLARVTYLCGMIGVDGYATLTLGEQVFIDDCRTKLARPETRMFGWRQVERIEEIYRRLEQDRANRPDATTRRTTLLAPGSLAAVEQARFIALEKHGPLKTGADRWLRLLTEEWEEVVDELTTLKSVPHNAIMKAKTIEECAQLAQLLLGVIDHLQR